ncbi:MAG: fibronectin type III domain-containing protein [Euryarchaeota archaeon]|nr:fibronectin type III domain-containing protein [Euryarchaeota archaeon]
MKIKIKRSALVSILFIIALIPLSAYAASVINVEPSNQNVLQGDLFTVNITVDPAGDEVMGAQYDLYFSNMLLNATDQVSGTFLSHDGASTMIITNEINNTLGLVGYGEMRMGVENGALDPGVLATITFKAIEPGTANLSLTNIIISDPLGVRIPGVLVNDGTVKINGTQLDISGFVDYSDGIPVNNPNVTITNLNTSEVFIAETNESSNYYLLSTNFAHIGLGNILHFNASDRTGNFTGLEHRVTQAEMDAVGFVQNITIDITAPVIANIGVTSITKDSAIISWETSEPGDSLVRYGTQAGNYTKVAHNASYVIDHSIVLVELLPNTTYYYVVNSTDPSSNSVQSAGHNFTTHPVIIIGIGDVTLIAGENATTSIMIHNITNVGTADIFLSYNQSVVHVTCVDNSDFDFAVSTIDNSSGVTRIGVYQISSPGQSGEVKLADVTLQSISNMGDTCALNLTITELKEAGPGEISIPTVSLNGTFVVTELTPPSVIHQIASPVSIPEDTDFDPRWGETSRLNATVIDESEVVNVTINLTTIGGLPDQPMTRVPGTDVWTAATNAPVGTTICHNESYLPHNLTVCATDVFGNVNRSISVQLKVILNGDVSENCEVALYDSMYLGKHLFGKPGFEAMSAGIGEVSGNGKVTLYDAMYLAKYVMGESGFEVLH